MKKVFGMFLVVSLVFINFMFLDVVNADYTIADGQEVLDRIDSSEPAVRDLVSKLTTWSNTHAESLKDLIDRNLIDDFSVDSVISKLRSNGKSSAANDLESIKPSIDSNIEYLNETFDMIEYYLDHDITTDNVDDTDIYYKLRSLFRSVKEPTNDLIKIYYNLYYDEINNKIDTYNDYNELIDLYKEMSDRFYSSTKLTEKLTKFKDMYISRDLEVYEPMIKDEFRSYYQTLKSDYDKLYEKLETKLQTKLDEKLDRIISPVNRSNVSEVIEANKKIYDIMSKINNVKTDVKDEFTKFKDFFSGVNIISEYTKEYEDKIDSRLTEAYEYTKSKLIDLDLIVSVKNESDKKFIKLDSEKGIIIYDSKDLAPSTLINKLTATYGELRINNTYNSKVGTKSTLEVYYENEMLKEFIIVVRGDINPTGKIDITDLVNLCDKMFGLKSLDEYETLAADFDNNNKIDITDLVNLCDRIYE